MSEPELPCDFSFGGVEMSSLVFFGEVYLVGDWEGVAGLVAHGFILDIICCACAGINPPRHLRIKTYHPPETWSIGFR